MNNAEIARLLGVAMAIVTQKFAILAARGMTRAEAEKLLLTGPPECARTNVEIAGLLGISHQAVAQKFAKLASRGVARAEAEHVILNGPLPRLPTCSRCGKRGHYAPTCGRNP